MCKYELNFPSMQPHCTHGFSYPVDQFVALGQNFEVGTMDRIIQREHFGQWIMCIEATDDVQIASGSICPMGHEACLNPVGHCD